MGAPVGLVLGTATTQQRIDNTAAIAAAMTGGVLDLPAGVIQLDYSTTNIPFYASAFSSNTFEIKGKGKGITILDFYPKSPTIQPTWSGYTGFGFFECSVVGGDGAHTLLAHDFTVAGPTSVYRYTAGDHVANSSHLEGYSVLDSKGFLTWVINGSTGYMKMENVDITGLFSTGVSRSGYGKFDVINCDIQCENTPVSRFVSGNSQALTSADRTTIINGTHSCYDGFPGHSVGFYVHPDIPSLVWKVHWKNFERYGYYINGTATEGVHHVAVDCTYEDAGVSYQSGTASVLNVIRATETRTGNFDSTGSVLHGESAYVDCSFAGREWGAFSGNGTNHLFKNATITPYGYWMSLTGDQLVTFENCNFHLTGTSLALNLTSNFTGRVTFKNCHIYDDGKTNNYFIIGLGGTIDVVDGLTIHTSRSSSNIDDYYTGSTFVGSITFV